MEQQPHFDETCWEHGTPRADALRAWARREAKSETMASDLHRQVGQGAVQLPTACSRFARVGAAVVVYGFVAALVLGSLFLSIQSTPQEPHGSATLAGVDGGAGREPLPYFGPFRP